MFHYPTFNYFRIDMKRKPLKFYFSIVTDDNGEFKAMMPVGIVPQFEFFYLMNDTGSHEFIPNDCVHSYNYIGNCITHTDANQIKSLLKVLNCMEDSQGAATYIYLFNQLAGSQKNLSISDKLFLNSKNKRVRFTESGMFY